MTTMSPPDQDIRRLDRQPDVIERAWDANGLDVTGYPIRAIIKAIAGKVDTFGPQYAFVQPPVRRPSAAFVDKNGRMWAHFQPRGAINSHVEYIGNTLMFRDALRRLCDRIHLSDETRVELFTEAGKWIGRDLRAVSHD